MSLRDKIEHAIQNQPCMVKDLKAKFGGDRAADRKVMEALDELVHDAVVRSPACSSLPAPAVPKRPCPARWSSWARTLPL